MPVPNSFANVTTSIPLSQLDANFNTPITLGNTAIQLGNTVLTLNNMTFANVTISSVSTPITVSQGGTGLTSLAADNVVLGNATGAVKVVAPGTAGNVLTSVAGSWVSTAPGAASGNITIGNTTISLGGTATSVGNLTLTNVSITSGSVTGITDIAIADGGTGASTKLVAFDNLSPLTTKGDLIGYDGTDNVRLAVGTNGQVLTANSSATTGLSWATASSGSGFSNIQVFTSSGTFTVPAGITKVKATVVGGGGGGRNDGGGGGGGGAAIEIVSGLTPGNTVTVTVGTGGAGGSTGGTGNTSSFGAFCSATGGAGGQTSPAFQGVLGGLGSGGDLNIRGGSGMPQISDGANNVGGGGGNSILGGGAPTPPTTTNASAGGAYGGGGAGTWGGGTASAGGAGVVIVEW